MSAHPNVILMAVLTTNNTSRKTLREILAKAHPGEEPDAPNYDTIMMGGNRYRAIVMEATYDDNWQIKAKEGDIVFFNMVTYGYGDVIEWDKLEQRHWELDAWASTACKTHDCTYHIDVTANHW